ncbi:iron-containing redox enzyme family protein [Klebsiella quasipneumoniae]|uniref:iron-containing redox enzyme family protein n=1 Tax=Klebsiella quasipneumoniae TaxID=1463165 RepID=UPI0022032E4A|nr:iron-containing redox enzyme family protein [Klebsiella quasipneumoniae]BDO04527.1 hypothetical protein KAM622c_41140 [Klebsiella quasipneumoniae subsp. quasipneumoniae]
MKSWSFIIPTPKMDEVVTFFIKEYQLPHTEDNFVSRLTTLCRTHRAATHPLFNYLSMQADDRQFDYFFRSDTALNVLFFDLVAMMLPGSYPFTRGEITKNLWDEAGQGNEHHNHVDLYNSLLKARDICPGKDQFASLYNWQGLTGYNVFLHHRYHHVPEISTPRLSFQYVTLSKSPGLNLKLDVSKNTNYLTQRIISCPG